MAESLSTYKAQDGQDLKYRKWEGFGDVLIYLHGVESHSGWFSDFALLLNRSGFTVYGLDRRGSGLNEYKKGDCEDYRLFFDDIDVFLRFAREENPSKRVYLIGICWGALLAVDYIADSPESVDGLVLLSPAIFRKVELPAHKRFAAIIASRLLPGLKFDIPIRDTMFTRSRRYLGLIRSDELRLRRLTARFFREILKMEEAYRSLNHRIDMPLITLLAGTDEIVDNVMVTKWFETITSADKTLRILSDCHHVMPFDDKPEELTGIIADWVRGRF